MRVLQTITIDRLSGQTIALFHRSIQEYDHNITHLFQQ
jgi:hypothetical protein